MSSLEPRPSLDQSKHPNEDPTLARPSAGNLLDSVFRKDGPMSPASIGLRGLAFLLDHPYLSRCIDHHLEIALPCRIPPHLLNYRNGHRHSSLGMATEPLQLMHPFLNQVKTLLKHLPSPTSYKCSASGSTFLWARRFLRVVLWANAFAASVA